jgi:hypothetical protein
MMARLLTGLGVLFLTFLCHAQIQESHREDCIFDPEIIAVPPCAIRHVEGHLQVVRSHMASRSFNKYGLTPIFLPDVGWTYVGRSGFIVIQNVAIMDNGANEFHHGLVRLTRDGKWGLADPHGKLVVPLQSDGALDYVEGTGWSMQGVP